MALEYGGRVAGQTGDNPCCRELRERIGKRMLNSSALVDQQPMNEELRTIAIAALRKLGRQVQDGVYG